MSKVTSKLQVTIPKKVADLYGIRPGDCIEWVPAGEGIRVVLAGVNQPQKQTVPMRLALFDEATRRLQARQTARTTANISSARGWTREDLYDRGQPG